MPPKVEPVYPQYISSCEGIRKVPLIAMALTERIRPIIDLPRKKRKKDLELKSNVIQLAIEPKDFILEKDMEGRLHICLIGKNKLHNGLVCFSVGVAGDLNYCFTFLTLKVNEGDATNPLQPYTFEGQQENYYEYVSLGEGLTCYSGVRNYQQTQQRIIDFLGADPLNHPLGNLEELNIELDKLMQFFDIEDNSRKS